MKKILLFLVLVISTLPVFAEDSNTYVSNIEHYSDRVVVTVSAKSSALKEYPNGFMVSVRPARHLFDALIITSKDEKTVRLSPDNPSDKVIFWCDENYAGKKACSRNDFVVTSKP